MFEGRDLICVRSERTVFAGLGFRLGPGGALVVRGPNGSGKSSLLRLAAGLLQPADGGLYWDGAPVAEAPEDHRARLCYLGHLDALKSAFTVAENLAFWAELHGRSGEAGAALARFGLARLAEVPVRLLSAGQRRRLSLARVLVSPAVLWLLDEPTVALDDESTRTLAGVIGEHRQGGGMVMAASHAELGLAAVSTLDLGGPPRPRREAS